MCTGDFRILIRSISFVAFSTIACVPSIAQTQNSRIEQPVIKRDIYGDPLPVGAVSRLGTLRYRHHDELTAFALSPDGKIAATGGGGRIGVFEIDTGKQHLLSQKDNSYLKQLVFSPDGKILAALENERCRTWSVKNWKEQFLVHEKTKKKLGSIAFTKAGKLLGIAESGLFRRSVISLADGKRIGSVPFSNSSESRELLSVDGKIYLNASAKGRQRFVTLWNVNSGKQISKRSISINELPYLGFTHSGVPVTAFSHANSLVRWSSGNHYIRFVDVTSGETLQNIVEIPDDKRFKKKFFDASCIGISRYTDLIATAAVKQWRDEDRNFAKVRIRNLTTKKEKLKITIPRLLAGEVQFSSDGNVVAIWKGATTSWHNNGSQFQSVEIWQLPKRKRLGQFVGHQAPVGSVSFSPDGKTLASSGFDGTVRLWDISNAKQIRKLDDSTPNGRSVTFSPDGRFIAASCSGYNGADVVVWNTNSGKPIYSFEVAEMETSASVTFSRDGNRLATGAIAYVGGYMLSHDPNNPPRYFGTIEVWDKEEFNKYPYGRNSGFTTLRKNFHLRGAMSEYRESVSSAAFSPDGTMLATGGWNSHVNVLDGSVISLWKIPEGKLIRKISPMKSAVGQIVFSPNGKLLASVSANSTFTNRFVSLFNKDKPTFDKEIHLWNPEDGSLVGKLKKHTAIVTSVAFSPDGKYLASASLDKTVHIWNVSTKKVVATLKGHNSGVLCVTFSPDGKLLATGSNDTTILLWDVASRLSKLSKH